MVEIVNFVKVQCSTYTHYNEASESKSLLRAIESARQMSTNIQNRFTFILLLISKIIHLQILLGIIQVFFNDFQGCAIKTHLFQCLAHLLTDSPVIIFCKSDTYSGDASGWHIPENY